MLLLAHVVTVLEASSVVDVLPLLLFLVGTSSVVPLVVFILLPFDLSPSPVVADDDALSLVEDSPSAGVAVPTE